MSELIKIITLGAGLYIIGQIILFIIVVIIAVTLLVYAWKKGLLK